MAVAEFEREIIRERVNAGLRAAKARGVRLGRPASNGVHGEAVRRLLAEGNGIGAIARYLGGCRWRRFTNWRDTEPERSSPANECSNSPTVA